MGVSNLRYCMFPGTALCHSDPHWNRVTSDKPTGPLNGIRCSRSRLQLGAVRFHSLSLLDVLPPCGFWSENALDCDICLENINSGDVIQGLNCNHFFHITCIQRWLVDHRTCPMCRSEVTHRVMIDEEAKGEDPDTLTPTESVDIEQRRSQTCCIT